MSVTRRLIQPLLLAVAGLTLFSGCQSQSTADNPMLRAAVAGNNGFSVRWQLVIPMETAQNETVRNLWRVGPRLYVATSQNRLYCVNASAGTLGWMEPMGIPSLPLYKPQDITVNGDTQLVVFTRTMLRRLDLATGAILAQRKLAFGVASDPVVAGDVICIGGADPYFRGLYSDLLGLEKWRVWSAKDAFESTPVIADNYVLFASHRGYIWYTSAENAGNGWERRTNGAVVAGVAADAKNAYIASLDNKVYAFDLNTSNPQWQTFVQGRLDQTPVVVGSIVVVVGSGKDAVGLSSDNGDLKWTVPDVRTVAAHTGDHVLMVDAKNNLLSVSTDAGSVDASFPLGPVQAIAHNTVDSTVYTISPDGLLLAIDVQK